MFKKILSVVLLAAATGFFANAAGAVGADGPDKKMSAEEFLASLHFQTGKITLPGGVATLDMPPSFRYLPPADATHLLVDGWGNPTASKTLGMIVPADVSPLSRNGWAVDISFDKDGHVKDDDANSIKYDELLKTMQDSTKEANEERKKSGFTEVSLIGWAEQPTYDGQTHKLYWAKNIKFADSPENTLNYNVRVLGRDGVLVLNAISSMGQIDQIKSEMRNVTAFTDFTAGNRYADFDSKTDKVAEYGIAALVAGGVAAKLGLFGKLFALLLAAKKVIFLAVAGIGGSIYKFFKGKKEE
ncbi:MAG TPA: DUF2167 domain-containing protein [Burkholderiaceae bacterium]|jgi:uncharacterized membrane-anchored protein